MLSICFLVLKDGTVLKGKSFGAKTPLSTELIPGEISSAAGEVVFNTGMTGYHEILTDPSYTGQLVLMTYPHLGNYGCLDEWSEIGPEDSSCRPGVKPSGFIARSYYEGPIGPGRESLSDFLKVNNRFGITDLDTRALTLKLRDEGSLNGVIVTPENGSKLSDNEIKNILAYLDQFPDMAGRNLVEEVGTDKVVIENPKGKKHVVLYDCGVKANIVREFVKRDCKVTIVPSSTTSKEILSFNPDLVMLSNGPGDPAMLTNQIETVKDLIGKVQLTGICLGHQIVSLALGAKTFKMKFGHHGCNHPVRDEFTKKVFVTSQNHGFAVDGDTLPSGVDVWLVNANDNSIEGIVNRELNIQSCQFHPEAAPGPEDSAWIFDAFIKGLK
ncbi:carbamoyl-phosphate synthase small subunit [Thiospirochaeta perfilievii]|uniref:Carbamoyl phosphate synthase small chain n=1 Tax=Thiospirochaeta perfilievii TaxID=252967 RepID=A0A5C1Q893_9SPIO|nr:glutamine-hydrolyzing carbamoyl-phosphate synthase small subunit [Thiospirochaeta perfilievii]QEN03260.1 carbamoyl-phosphate synthase small subunit [Thiospirochaeta perfilievii]